MNGANSRTGAYWLDGAIGLLLVAALAGLHSFDRVSVRHNVADPVAEAANVPPESNPRDTMPALAANEPPSPAVDAVTAVAANEPSGPLAADKPQPDDRGPADVPPTFVLRKKQPDAVVAALMDEPSLNQYGNPEGDGFGLCRTGEFAGARLLVWTAEPQARDGIFVRDNPLWAALKDKGFDVHLAYGRFDQNWLEQVDQLWIFAGQVAGLQRADEEAIVSFVDAGNGLYLIAENEPFLFDVSSLAARLFGIGVSGDYRGEYILAVRGHGVTRDDYRRLGAAAKTRLTDQDAEGRLSAVIGRATHYVEEHALLTDVNFIYEGITISHIEPTPRLHVVLTASDGQILAAVSRDARRRVVVDCGYTRFFYSATGGESYVTETAGTLRYAENVAAYLMCKDDKRADGAKWREKRRLLAKYRDADRSTILAGLKSSSPEERWAAVVEAIQQRLDIAEALIELLLDRQSEICGQARQALVQLADGADYGPEANAPPNDRKSAQKAWTKFFKRRLLFARAMGLSPAELVAAFLQPDLDERLTALRAAIDRRMDLAEQFVTLVEDPEVEIRSEARRALVRLAQNYDFGPAETASADEIRAARGAWSIWLKRRALLALAGKMSPDELASWRSQSEPDQRWAAVMAAIQRQIYVPDQLIELLQDPESDIRAAAHRALVQLAKGADFGPATDGDESARIAAIVNWHRWRVATKFSTLVNKANVEDVAAALGAADAEERWAAIIAVHNRKLPLVDELFDRLGDLQTSVQQEARQTLCNLARNKDFGPERGASPEAVAESGRQWKAWWKQEREELASQKLKLAKSLMANNRDGARRRLQDIVKEHPKTQAAREAQRLLNESSR